ncbi:MAG: transcription-repair coupling factor [Clostridia bacterium]|nr:transcription-repair coupling factor [Clostridia bacterium]
MANQLLKILDRSEEFGNILAAIGGGPLCIYGLGDAHKAHVTASIRAHVGAPMLFVAASEASAVAMHEELKGYWEDALLLPARDINLSARTYAQSSEVTGKRISALRALRGSRDCIVVCSIGALLQRVAPPAALFGSDMELRVGESVDLGALASGLSAMGYERSQLCEGRGQFAVRGGYVDVFPLLERNPVRIELFGDEIDSMRSYDPVTQRSTGNIDSVYIAPASELPHSQEALKLAAAGLKGVKAFEHERELILQGAMPSGALNLLPFMLSESCICDYLPADAVIVLDEPPRLDESAELERTLFAESLADALEHGLAHKRQRDLLLPQHRVTAALDTSRTVMLFSLVRTYNAIRPKAVFNLQTRTVSSYANGLKPLADDMRHWKQSGAGVLIMAGSHAERVKDELDDYLVSAPLVERLERQPLPAEALIVRESAPRGFEYTDLRVVVVTERELYGRRARRAARPRGKRPSLTFEELEIGDLVVHEAHGVARYTGVETIVADGVLRDYIKLQFQGTDAMFLPTDQLDRVQKYVGADGNAPKLSSLNSHEWQRTVARTRESVKKLAFDLVKLYGERSRRRGFSFSPDTPWQAMMESSFSFEMTPDQLRSVEEIKRDMESAKVMDRLLCGDVGYGKTEVALRSAFKAIMDSRQVIFLVPTTILAQQHYNTAISRFHGFPVRVRMLSRFNSPAETARILEELADGSCDMVIGTHKLLGKRVKFKNPGLLIVDEEQRFGVGHKEQIKLLKQELDVLTLSATPIPRTLHMSMTGIRDMSVIETPPEERYPVQTYVMEESPAIMREAILKEMGRGGQVFVLYNKVQSMSVFADELRRLTPEARIATAHGRMSERLLENTMLDFIEHQYDVLVCSTIIENGLDVTNANTIIVIDADKLGLAQLYQLRGRVGRSTRLAYAYLMFKRDSVLTEEAAKRLQAIRDFTQFGSGFRIAMRDLEIRGAGNLLGAEQHGFMQDVGYDMYCKLIDEAVKEARGEKSDAPIDTAITIPANANIPREYISREQERLAMYRRIALIDCLDDLRDVQDELIDRYGAIPDETQALLDIALLKAEARRAYITKLSAKTGELRLTFSADAPYDTGKLLEFASGLSGARLINSAPPTMLITGVRARLDGGFRSLFQIVHALLNCIDA